MYLCNPESYVDIICVQKHCFFHLLKHHDIGNDWLLVTSSAVKNTVNATIGDVGILLSPNAQKSLDNIESITPRILVASFNGNPKNIHNLLLQANKRIERI